MLLGIDSQILNLVQSNSNSFLDLVFYAVSSILGHPGFWVIVAAFFYWSNREKDSFYLMFLIGITGAVVGVLKEFFQIPRPSASEYRVLDSYESYGFPSGHASLASSAAAYFWNSVKKWKYLLIAMVITVAYSRMYLGAHFFSDVVAGTVLGIILGIAVLKFRKKTEHMHFKISKAKEELLLFAAVIASIAVIYFFREIVLSAIFIGYFAGYLLWKEMNLQQTGKSWKRKILGFAGLSVFAYSWISSQNTETAFISLLLAGLWISFIYPFAVEKILKQNKTFI